MGINIFIGSASESLDVARELQAVLNERRSDLTAEVWDQGTFKASGYTMQDLTRKLSDCHYAIFIFSADDISLIRGEAHLTARDNVVLELGIAMGILGQKKCFVFKEENVKLPSDYYGITAINYHKHTDADLRVKINTAATALLDCIDRNSMVYVSWENYWHNLCALHKKLSLSPRQGGFRYDAIIGLSRGGCAAADFICRLDLGEKPILCAQPDFGTCQPDIGFNNVHDNALFDIIEKLNYKNLLVIDDISRTGNTLCSIKDCLTKRFPDRNIKLAALYVDAAHKNHLDYYVQTTDIPLKLCMPYSD